MPAAAIARTAPATVTPRLLVGTIMTSSTLRDSLRKELKNNDTPTHQAKNLETQSVVILGPKWTDVNNRVEGGPGRRGRPALAAPGALSSRETSDEGSLDSTSRRDARQGQGLRTSTRQSVRGSAAAGSP